MHQSIPPAPSQTPPPATAGHLPALLGAVHLPTTGLFPSFWHARSFLSEYLTTQRVLLEKKQTGSFVKDRNILKRVVKACSRFYACISSLLIKPTIHTYNGGQKCWDLSSDITKTSDSSPPTPNKVEFGAKWGKLSAFLATTLLGEVGGRWNEPKAEQKIVLRSRILRNYCLEGLFHTVPSSFVLHCLK